MTSAIQPAPKSVNAFILPGLLLIAAMAISGLLRQLSGVTLATFLVSVALSAAAYLWSISLLHRCHPSAGIVWIVALLMRIPLLFSPPYLSSDVQRYIWDGHLLGSGVNPYFAPVESPLLDAYATPVRDLVQHPWMASPYLPLAQVYFGLIGWLAPGSAFAFQLSALTFDLAAGWLLWLWLPRQGLPSSLAMIYLWHPLLALEFTQGAHVDALMLLLLMIALFLSLGWQRHAPGEGLRQTLSVIFFAGAVLVKGFPLLLAPVLLPRWGWRRLLLLTLLILAALAPFGPGAGWGVLGPLDGTGIFGAARIYGAYWQFNPGFYALASAIFTGLGIPVELSGLISRWLSALLMGVVTVWLARAAWRQEQPVKLLQDSGAPVHKILFLLLVYFLLAPTLHPWYLTLLIPLLALLWRQPTECPLLMAGLYLSLAVLLSYTLYFVPDGSFQGIAVGLVQHLPAWGLLGFWLWSNRVRPGAASASSSITYTGGNQT